MKPTTRRDKWTFARWRKEAWKVFSAFIRKRDGGICYTCHRKCEGSGYHAGHYAAQAASNLEARFNPTFVRGQCYNCNMNLSGNHIEYRKRLVAELGEERVKDFENTYKRLTSGPKFSVYDLQQIISKYGTTT